MNIHLPAILMFTRGIGFWPIPKWSKEFKRYLKHHMVSYLAPDDPDACFLGARRVNSSVRTLKHLHPPTICLKGRVHACMDACGYELVWHIVTQYNFYTRFAMMMILNDINDNNDNEIKRKTTFCPFFAASIKPHSTGDVVHLHPRLTSWWRAAHTLGGRNSWLDLPWRNREAHWSWLFRMLEHVMQNH